MEQMGQDRGSGPLNCELLMLLVGERGFEPPTPWSRTERKSNPKCFDWCRLGAKNLTFSRP